MSQIADTATGLDLMCKREHCPVPTIRLGGQASKQYRRIAANAELNIRVFLVRVLPETSQLSDFAIVGRDLNRFLKRAIGSPIIADG